MQFVSADGKEITATEGYRIVPEEQLEHVDPKDVELLIIPGGDIEKIDTPEVWKYLKSVHDLGGRIAAICAGVDVVEHAGLLEGIESTHSGEKDVVTSDISPIAHRIGKNAIRIAIPEILCRPFIGNPLFMHIAYHINV